MTNLKYTCTSKECTWTGGLRMNYLSYLIIISESGSYSTSTHYVKLG